MSKVWFAYRGVIAEDGDTASLLTALVMDDLMWSLPEFLENTMSVYEQMCWWMEDATKILENYSDYIACRVHELIQNCIIITWTEDE